LEDDSNAVINDKMKLRCGTRLRRGVEVAQSDETAEEVSQVSTRTKRKCALAKSPIKTAAAEEKKQQDRLVSYQPGGYNNPIDLS
jgi:hypothetical protein